MALLEIRNLSVTSPRCAAACAPSTAFRLSIDEGEVLGIVGEFGSGKSVAMLAVMGLVAHPGEVAAQRLHFAGRDLLTMGTRERRHIAGKDIAMIFQEPMTSLNPCYPGRLPDRGDPAHPRRRTRLNGASGRPSCCVRVGIPDPGRRLAAFPHQFSGGMNQRVMIAMAIACNPTLLIADEPTTALDVTIQAQILDLLLRSAGERGMALVLITHDMGVVAETAHRVLVMYAGQMVEEQPTDALFAAAAPSLHRRPARRPARAQPWAAPSADHPRRGARP